MSELFLRVWVRISTSLYREEGQAATEYAVVLALIALIAAALYAAGVGATIVGKITTAIGKI